MPHNKCIRGDPTHAGRPTTTILFHSSILSCLALQITNTSKTLLKNAGCATIRNSLLLHLTYDIPNVPQHLCSSSRRSFLGRQRVGTSCILSKFFDFAPEILPPTAALSLGLQTYCVSQRQRVPDMHAGRLSHQLLGASVPLRVKK